MQLRTNKFYACIFTFKDTKVKTFNFKYSDFLDIVLLADMRNEKRNDMIDKRNTATKARDYHNLKE